MLRPAQSPADGGVMHTELSSDGTNTIPCARSPAMRKPRSTSADSSKREIAAFADPLLLSLLSEFVRGQVPQRTVGSGFLSAKVNCRIREVKKLLRRSTYCAW
jgi:hypothetical protein